MIKVKFFKNSNNDIYCFEVVDHGDSIVCAGVSALTFNTINSIDKFTDCDFTTDIDDQGRILFICDSLKKEGKDKDTSLILKCFELGIQGIKEEYKNDIEIKYEEV